MNKKVLILQDSLCAQPDANSKLVFRLCEQLVHLGYDVSVMGVARNKEDHVSDYHGIHLIHEPADRVNAVQRLTDRLGKFKWLRYAVCPRTIGYRLNIHTYSSYYMEARWWLKRNISSYDVLIACCSPYYPLSLAAEVADRIPVIYYKIDPVGTHDQNISNWDERLATIANEIKWDDVTMRIITTDVIYHVFNQLPTRVNAHKVVLASYPNVRRLPVISNQQSVNSKQCNLYFIGKLYADIRNPQYLFDLIEKLKGTGIMLHIVGPISYKGFDKAFIEKYFKNNVPNICYHGAVSPAEADTLLTQADVLVHIGNTIDSQMPSKILDYISSGKPILNICKIRTCPTIPLMERYPLGLTIFEDEGFGIRDERLEEVKDFCITNKGKQIPYEEIEKIYPECTIEYVGKQFDEAIQDAIREFKQK